MKSRSQSSALQRPSESICSREAQAVSHRTPLRTMHLQSTTTEIFTELLLVTKASWRIELVLKHTGL